MSCPCRDLAQFSFSIVAALAPVLLLGSAARAEVHWPPNYTVERVECASGSATVTLTVGGVWFCPAIPTGVHTSLNGTQIDLVVEWAYAAPPPCAAVLTPWTYRTVVNGLTPSVNYSTVARFQGPLNLQPVPRGPFNTDCACAADFDDGSGLGHPDGGIGVEDLLYYLDQYSAGAVRADLDDGSGTGTRDGGVGIEDLLYFLVRYDAGC